MQEPSPSQWPPYYISLLMELNLSSKIFAQIYPLMRYIYKTHQIWAPSEPLKIIPDLKKLTCV